MTKTAKTGDRLPFLIAKMKAPRLLERLEQTAARARDESWAFEQSLEDRQSFDSPIVRGSIMRIDVSNVAYDILIGGLPCQGNSVLWQHEGVRTSRGALCCMALDTSIRRPGPCGAPRYNRRRTAATATARAVTARATSATSFHVARVEPLSRSCWPLSRVLMVRRAPFVGVLTGGLVESGALRPSSPRCGQPSKCPTRSPSIFAT
jgi:hypothetical protein